MALGINILVEKNSNYVDWTSKIKNNLIGYLDKKLGHKPTVNLIHDLKKLEVNTVLLVVIDNELINNQEKVNALKEICSKQVIYLLEPMLVKHELPAFFYTQKRYKFYLYDVVEDSYSPTGHAKSGRLGAEYWSKLFDLSNSVMAHGSKSSTSNVKIFVADTSKDLLLMRDNLIRDLKESGIEIFPDYPLSSNQDQRKIQIKEMLEMVDYSIHMFGASQKEFLELQTQNSIASGVSKEREITENKLIRYIWTPVGLRLSEDQRLVFETFKRDQKSMHGAELIQAPLETLKTLVYSEISRNDSTMNNGLDSYQDAVYIINEIANAEGAAEVEKLLNSKGVKTVRSAFDQSDMAILSRHKQILRECIGCLLYHPSSNKMWLKSTMDDIVKSPGYGRKQPYKSIGLMSKESGGVFESRFATYSFIDLNNKIDASAFDSFVKQLSE